MSQHLREAWKSTAMDYWMNHRPDEDGGPAYDLLEPEPGYGTPRYPADIYTQPRHYTSYWNLLPETMATLNAARGNPGATITIYRAQKPSAGLNTGDWVTLSRGYAEQDLESGPEDDGREVEVYHVPASTVRYAGDDLMEFGYFGPTLGKDAGRPA